MDPKDTLNEAMRLIDPEGMLIPGTRQHARIREMVDDLAEAAKSGGGARDGSEQSQVHEGMVEGAVR